MSFLPFIFSHKFCDTCDSSIFLNYRNYFFQRFYRIFGLLWIGPNKIHRVLFIAWFFFGPLFLFCVSLSFFCCTFPLIVSGNAFFLLNLASYFSSALRFFSTSSSRILSCTF